jgi:ABC-type multidrug transport system ATPase subunit
LLNGQNISISSFSKRIAYVPAEAKLAPNLSVAQTLAFYSHLRKAPARAIPKVSQNDQVCRIFKCLKNCIHFKFNNIYLTSDGSTY